MCMTSSGSFKALMHYGRMAVYLQVDEVGPSNVWSKQAALEHISVLSVLMQIPRSILICI